jgi:adenylate cyclase
MAQHRQLAAILFTDIEGYTALVAQQEGAAARLRARHREILDKEHQRHHGRLIQNYGEGTLSTFASAVEAVRCALDMQQLFSLPPQVPVRMALHIGDIIVEEQQVIGDGVNLAARIQSLGVAGSVLLSDKVNDEILNHPDLQTVPVGTYQFKNILRPVEVFALNHEGLVVPAPNSLTGKIAAPKAPAAAARPLPDKSIAVLPLVNLSNDPEQKYFSDGVAEEILSALSNLPDLKVAGRTSSFQFNSKDNDLREVGQKLGVRTVLEGSVRKQGNRLRVMVQLVNVEDGFHLWSEKYDRTLDDVFAIQDEIAQAVTEKMKVTFQQQDRGRSARSYTQNTEAYELYLKGRFFINRRGAFILTGIRYFEQAMDLDPDFALAHAGYADANLMAAFYGMLPPLPAMRRAKRSADTAMALDPGLCEPYCSLAYYYAAGEWNWDLAESYFQEALARNPQYAQAHYWYGINLLAWVRGDYELAEQHGALCVQLEPLSAVCHGIYASILLAGGKFEQALAVARAGIELDPESFLCLLYEGWGTLFLGQYPAAIQSFERLIVATNKHHFALSALIIAYCKTGNEEGARALFEEIKGRCQQQDIACTGTGITAAYLQDLDGAMAYLEKGFAAHDPLLLTLKYEHWVPENLKADPRFQELLERIGFPEKAPKAEALPARSTF